MSRHELDELEKILKLIVNNARIPFEVARECNVSNSIHHVFKNLQSRYIKRSEFIVDIEKMGILRCIYWAVFSKQIVIAKLLLHLKSSTGSRVLLYYG